MKRTVEFTAQEQQLLETLRSNIADAGMGVTLIEDSLTIRLGKGAINLKVELVTPGKRQPDECHLCGGSDKLAPATVTVEQAGGETVVYEDFTCVDCYCPK